MEATGEVELITEGEETSRRTQLILRIVTIWHVLLAVLALAGILFLWLGNVELSTVVRVIGSFAFLITAAISLFAARGIKRREHRGRVASLALNYLWFIGCLVASLHYFGIFIGIDSLAENLARGLPFLGIVVAGYILRGFASRVGDDYKRAGRIRRAGNIVMLAGFLIFMLVVGLIAGIVTVFGRMADIGRIGLVVGSILFGTMTVLMWRAPVAKAMGEKISDNEMLNGYLFLSPNLLGFLLFFAGPLLFSLYISFTDSDAFGQPNWIGLANYAEIFNLDFAQLESADQNINQVLDVGVYNELVRFSILGRYFLVGAQDKLFWISLKNTAIFVLLAVPFSVVPALVLASILNSQLRGMKVFRTVYFMPSVAAVVGVALIWRWLYNSAVGWINYAITNAVNAFNGLAGSEVLTDPQIGWLTDTNVALLAVVIIASWQWLGFNTILYLAGLQGIPGVLYEAAQVDGAGIWTRFRRLTVPLLAPTTFFVLTTTTIQAMQLFDQVFVLINPPGSGGPGTSTLTMVLYLYNQGFRNFRQGYAAAIAWVLFFLIFAATIFQFQRQRTAGAVEA
jgi:ABC-type sugar transport system permease subunit